MKNVLKILGIIVMMAVIGFPMVSCGDDGDGGIVNVIGGVLELTGLETYNDKYIVAWGNNDTLVGLSVNKQNGVKVSKGGATLSVWNIEGTEGTPTFTAYKGSDTVLFWVIVSDDPSVNFIDGSDGGEGGWALGKFTNGAGGAVFTDKLSDINIPDTNGGILTLTNLEKYNGKYVVARADDEALVAAKNVNAQTGKGVKISGGKAILNVWKAEGSGQSYTPYKGNDTVIFSVTISETASVNLANDSNGGWALATFQKGIGAGVFTDVLSNIDIPDTKSGKLTLTGLGNFEGKYVAAFGSDDDDSLHLIAASSVNVDDQAGVGVKIKNGKAVLNVWEAKGDDETGYTISNYKGTDTVKFSVGIFNTENIKFGEETESGENGYALATFKNGIGAGYFSLTDIENPGEQPSPGIEISVNITVPSTLVGTWKGDEANGTMVFTASTISATDSTKAYAFIAAIKQLNTGTNTVTINSNEKIIYTAAGIVYSEIYSWTIANGTLTIVDNIKNTTAFTGTKQP